MRCEVNKGEKQGITLVPPRLYVLRALCERGRAAPPSDEAALARLFAAPRRDSPTSWRPARARLPDEVFWHVLAYWRGARDSYDRSPA